MYRHLREQIVTKEISPGSQLVEKSIEAELSVSRTPIRQAIRRLCDEGFAKLYAHRGAFVMNPSETEVLQAFEMWKYLEIKVAELVYNQVTYSDLQQLNKWISEGEQAWEAGDVERYLEADKEFHLLLAWKTGNELLHEFLERIINQVHVYVRMLERHSKTIPVIGRVKDHYSVVDALEEQDLSLLQTTLDEHTRYHATAWSWERSRQ
ncbi:GntR family transcriptional regulator [Halobacillus sp. ACCC02827]|uniref:GntR family transcriptional regulator n=1 Tax=Bacillaceae TaxID=186817 RepID=UPI0002A4EFC4|nr:MULTISPECIES: GntR family transcriptional regulator [Bacillaceae]ELK48892.1 GntR family transcriptional regulator [Halobacillus sp. BAB-2008]QHT45778.1 GntR family transcriptional regulator [Bacillus sp. SB49]WJE16580.1 GntR family transcriptional regulator [Halobacillus sp. ACCC02827]